MNVADLTTEDAPLSTLVTSHDVYWCIEPSSGLSLWRQLQKETVSVHVAAFASAQAAQKREEAEKPRAYKPYAMQGSKAMLSLSGTLTKAPTSFSGGTSTVRFRRMLALAARDPDVSEIVLLIDSPGGSASGTDDAAQAVATAAKIKPVVAYCEDMCCSAAYWIASQASRIVANPTAMVGSIGTLLVVYDYSRMAANEGIEPIVFGTGAYKGAGVPGTVITPEQRAHFQRIVDDLNSHFLAAVQSGRGLTDEQISAVSTADVWIGQAAVDRGLVDEIASLDTVLADAGTDSAARRGKEKEKMQIRGAIARTLAAIGFSGIAGAMLARQDDEPEAIASDLAAQIEKEVQNRLDAHPVMKALTGAGATTEADAKALVADATAYREEAQAELQAAAIRAFRQEEGVRRAEALRHLPAAEKRPLAESFNAIADNAHGITTDANGASTGPGRVSAPKRLPNAENAESNGEAESSWGQLTAVEKRIAQRFGVTDASPEAKREKYAAEVLKRRN